MGLRRLLAAAILLGLSSFTASSIQAAPAPGTLAAPGADTLVEKVWGQHRSCEWGRRLGWHRHTRFNNRVVPCQPDRSDDYGDSDYDDGGYYSDDDYSTGNYEGPSQTYPRIHSRNRRNRHWQRLPERNCHKDWHCVDNGNPLDGKRICFWRDICD